MKIIVKFFVFCCWILVGLVSTVNAANNVSNDSITITFKNPKDCPDADEITRKAMLECAAGCAFDHFSKTMTKDVFMVDGGRELQSCSNCNAYCNCRQNYSQSYCAAQYSIGCRTVCGCNRRSLRDARSLKDVLLVGDAINEKTFENEIISQGSLREVHGINFWECASERLVNNAKTYALSATKIANMLNCINKNITTWTNMM